MCPSHHFRYVAFLAFVIVSMQVLFAGELQTKEDIRFLPLRRDVVKEQVYEAIDKPTLREVENSDRNYDSQGEDDQQVTICPSHRANTSLISVNNINEIPDEIFLEIFAHLNQIHVPIVVRVCRLWARLLDDDQLWKRFATKARIGINAFSRTGKSHKELVKHHCCTFTFTDLGRYDAYSNWVISSDGSLIFGSPTGRGYESCRWTLEGILSLGILQDLKGGTNIGTLNGGSGFLIKGANADGTVIVGQAYDGLANNEARAFRWTQRGGLASLGTLNQDKFSRAEDVNVDGSVVVGYSAISNCTVDQDTAFRWTFVAGMTSLGFLNGGRTSRARAVSGNGLVVVGAAKDGVSGKERAFRWTAQEQTVPLGTLIYNRESSSATAVNFDGSVIGGVSSQFDTHKATRWTPQKGLESIEKVLTDQGISLAGMTLTEVTSLSASGTSFVGKGVHIIDDGIGPRQFLRHVWHAIIPRGNLF